MSERTMPVTVEDIERFFRAKGGLRPCLVCWQEAGYDTFDEVAARKRYAIFRFQFPDYGTENLEAADVILVECKHCHALRIHNRKPIVDWVHANPASRGHHS